MASCEFANSGPIGKLLNMKSCIGNIKRSFKRWKFSDEVGEPWDLDYWLADFINVYMVGSVFCQMLNPFSVHIP